MGVFSGEFFTRSEFLKRLNEAGYPITNNDITWAVKHNLLRPITLKSNFFGYTAEDFIWMEELGRLKQKGVDKSVLVKILEADALDNVVTLIQRMRVD